MATAWHAAFRLASSPLYSCLSARIVRASSRAAEKSWQNKHPRGRKATGTKSLPSRSGQVHFIRKSLALVISPGFVSWRFLVFAKVRSGRRARPLVPSKKSLSRSMIRSRVLICKRRCSGHARTQLGGWVEAKHTKAAASEAGVKLLRTFAGTKIRPAVVSFSVLSFSAEGIARATSRVRASFTVCKVGHGSRSDEHTCLLTQGVPSCARPVKRYIGAVRS